MASTQIIGGIGGQYDIVFDALLPYVVQFAYNGNQVVKNRMIVKDNKTNDTVYDNTVTSMAKRHTIPAGTLTHGVTYNLTIQVYDLDEEAHEVAATLSDTALVKCYSTPRISFSNFQTTIRNATYDFKLSYSQSENDYIDSYRIALYDANNLLLYRRDAVYPASSEIPYVFSVRIGDLIDQSTYYIECSVTTVSGMTASTGRMSFSVEYNRPPNYSVIYVDNIPNACSVRIASNIKIIDGFTTSGEGVKYLDSGEADLRGDGVFWADMLNISGDFQTLIGARDMNDYTVLLELNNGKNFIQLKSMRGLLYGETAERFYLELFVSNGYNNYMTTSNLIPLPTADDKYLISLVRRGNLYSVEIRRE